MKKLFFLPLLFSLLFTFSCGSDEDEGPGPIEEIPCLSDQDFGLVDIDPLTIDFISEEMRDSTIAIFSDEDGNEINVNISDGNSGQVYIKRLAEQAKTFSCTGGSFSATYTPQEFYLLMKSEDETFEIEWKISVEAAYNSADGRIDFRDVLTVTGTNRAMGDMAFINKHTDGPVGPELVGGVEFEEIFIHGVKYIAVFLDRFQFENSSLIVNVDFGLAAFKDRFNNWWRHIDFK